MRRDHLSPHGKLNRSTNQRQLLDRVVTASRWRAEAASRPVAASHQHSSRASPPATLACSRRASGEASAWQWRSASSAIRRPGLIFIRHDGRLDNPITRAGGRRWRAPKAFRSRQQGWYPSASHLLAPTMAAPGAGLGGVISGDNLALISVNHEKPQEAACADARRAALACVDKRRASN